MNNPRVYIAGYHALVSCFSLDLGDGSLTLLSTSVAGAKPTYMAHHPSGRFMYALDDAQPGRISAYAVDPQDGRLTRLNVVSSAGDGPCHLSVHPNGRWVFTANYVSGTIGVLPVLPDGGLGEPITQCAPGKKCPPNRERRGRSTPLRALPGIGLDRPVPLRRSHWRADAQHAGDGPRRTQVRPPPSRLPSLGATGLPDQRMRQYHDQPLL